MNVCAAFTFLKGTRTFISRYCRNKLHMGCDYYIDKNLDVYHSNDMLMTINIEHERGYYWFISSKDEDEDGYDDAYSEYVKDILKPSMKPIVIYSNKTFHKSSFEMKYKQMIENEIIIYNKTMNDVNKIMKIEKRYERL